MGSQANWTVFNSITLCPPGPNCTGIFDVSVAAQTTPGTKVEIMQGRWMLAGVLHQPNDADIDATVEYTGVAIAAVQGGGNRWHRLQARVHVPTYAASGRNGTALQLRVTPAKTKRGWGGTAWVDSVSVVEAK